MRFVSTLAMVLCALEVSATHAGPPGTEWTAPPETQDRVPAEEIERLVARPMAKVEDGDLAGGIAVFEEMLRDTRAARGEQSAEVADLLIAFGVGLYMEHNTTDDPAVAEASLKYMRESVDAYRAAFGPIHPEVALAINSYADAIYQAAPDGEVPPEVISLLKDSLRIRLATLGKDNVESRANMAKLANRMVERAKHAGSPTNEAEELYRGALRNAPANAEADRITGAVPIRLNLAQLLAESGRSDAALKELEIVVADAAAWPEDQRCWRILPALQEIAATFADQGKGDFAAKLAIMAETLGCAGDEEADIVASA